MERAAEPPLDQVLQASPAGIWCAATVNVLRRLRCRCRPCARVAALGAATDLVWRGVLQQRGGPGCVRQQGRVPLSHHAQQLPAARTHEKSVTAALFYNTGALPHQLLPSRL